VRPALGHGLVFGLGDLVGGELPMKFKIPDDWLAAIAVVIALALLSAGFIFGTILGWFDRWQ